MGNCASEIAASRRPERRGGAQGKTKRRPSASVSFAIGNSPFARLPQPPRGMREKGIDQPGFRGEVGAKHLRTAIVACHVVEQALELADVAVDGLLEAAVGAIFARDLVECFLSRRRVEALG